MSLPKYPEYKDSGVSWLGEVPAHWEIRTLKSLAIGRDAKFIDGDWIESKSLSDAGIRYYTTGNVGLGFFKEQGQGYISDETYNSLGCTEVFPGDIFISRLNAPIGRACLVPSVGSRIVTSVDNVIFRPDLNWNRSFLVYALSAPYYLAATEILASGATMQRIARSELGAVRLVVPERNEQDSIALFLDRETAKIDALIAEQEKLIALLAEKRQATISRAVTRGLDPNVPLKDSGVPWLGKVPAHWEVCAVRRILSKVEQGWSPECESRPAEDGEWGVLKAGCVNRGIFDPQENKALPNHLQPVEELMVKAGDLLMSRASGSPQLVGSVAYISDARFGLMLSDKIFRLHLTANADPKYFAWQFNSKALRTQIERAISGADGLANNLPQSSMKEFSIAKPPVDEQRHIAAFLEKAVAQLEILSAEASKAILLLKERRAALISAAVTGKIDVRGLAA